MSSKSAEKEKEENPFDLSYKKRIKEALSAQSFPEASNALFGPLADRYMDSFSNLRDDLDKSGLSVLFRTYLSEMFFIPFFVYVTSLASLIAVTWFFEFPLLLKVIMAIFYPVIVATLSFILMYIRPSMMLSQRADDIESNLPFALNHMASVSGSGVTPSSMFDLLQNFDEYGEIAKESNKIVRRMNVFGEDLTTALREVARKSPSEKFKEILYGMLSTIETGGDLDSYLKEQAESALFEYKMRMKREIDTLSTYASFYTAILVAAPLFLVFILAVLNMMGGSIAGMAISDVMRVGIYVIIPTVNSVFLTILALRKKSYL